MLNEKEKIEFGLTFDADGEWWMEFDDFLTYYDELEMCHMCPEKMLGVAKGVSLAVKSWHGEWMKAECAIECREEF